MLPNIGGSGQSLVIRRLRTAHCLAFLIVGEKSMKKHTSFQQKFGRFVPGKDFETDSPGSGVEEWDGAFESDGTGVFTSAVNFGNLAAIASRGTERNLHLPPLPPLG